MLDIGDTITIGPGEYPEGGLGFRTQGVVENVEFEWLSNDLKRVTYAVRTQYGVYSFTRYM